MVGKTKHRNKQDNERLDILSRFCFPCMLDGWDDPQGTIQHVTEGGRRLEDQHQKTYPACSWHHLGWLPGDASVDFYTDIFGPSFAHSKRAYVARYGSELGLIVLADKVVRETLVARARGEWLTNRDVGILVRNWSADEDHPQGLLQGLPPRW